MEKILITGGAGFIGSHLAESLTSEDFRVILVDNFDIFYNPDLKKHNISHLRNLPNVSFYEVDILHPNQLERIFTEESPSVVIHLAARPGDLPSMKSPRNYYMVNVQGTLNVLDLAQRFHTRHFIFGSSASVYGENAKIPFQESMNNFKPLSPYAHSKLIAESKCKLYSKQTDMNVCCLRLFTVYGPRQRPDMAIYKFTRALLFDDPITLYGDGTTSRDYTYVDDIVNGIKAALSLESKWEIINIGRSKTVKLIDMVHLLEDVTGHRARLHYIPKQNGEISTVQADICKAERLLNYVPYISFDDGVHRFVEWYRNKYNIK